MALKGFPKQNAFSSAVKMHPYFFHYSDKLIRTAFQSFQLVVTDYLSVLRPDCYPACVNTAAKFGHQGHDLNIALAAIGSLVR